MIPLDVGNFILREHLVDLRHQVLVGSWVGDIQHVLVATFRWNSVTDLENPVRVCSVDIGIGIEHFALKPKTKLHTAGMNLFD